MADSKDDFSENWEDLEDSGELDKRLAGLKTEPRREVNSQTNTMLTDETRTAYQPQIKILKRQPNSDSQVNANNVNKLPPKPLKTLEQREAEYAEARLRILGSASCEEEPSPNEERPDRLVQNIEALKVTENVLRQPKGPDGTKGFNSIANKT